MLLSRSSVSKTVKWRKDSIRRPPPHMEGSAATRRGAASAPCYDCRPTAASLGLPCSIAAARRRSSPGNFYLVRSEEHTSELQSLMRISYAVFCLKKKIYTAHDIQITRNAVDTIDK